MTEGETMAEKKEEKKENKPIHFVIPHREVYGGYETDSDRSS